jgi:hypothetical protein
VADDASQVEEDDDGGGTASSAAYTSAQLPGLSREDKRIAYHGVPGAFGEAAALLACPDWQAIPCNGFEVVFQVRLPSNGASLSVQLQLDWTATGRQNTQRKYGYRSE